MSVVVCWRSRNRFGINLQVQGYLFVSLEPTCKAPVFLCMYFGSDTVATNIPASLCSGHTNDAPFKYFIQWILVPSKILLYVYILNEVVYTCSTPHMARALRTTNCACHFTLLNCALTVSESLQTLHMHCPSWQSDVHVSESVSLRQPCDITYVTRTPLYKDNRGCDSVSVLFLKNCCLASRV